MKRNTLPVTLATSLAACGSSVYEIGFDEGSGIPVLRMETVRDTTYVTEQRWWELELKVVKAILAPAATAADKPKEIRRDTLVLRVFTTDEAAAMSVARAYNLGADGEDAVNKVKNTFATVTAPFTEAAPTGPANIKDVCSLPLLSVQSLESLVPSRTPYYINVHRPALSSAGATIELKDNGTLGSAAGNAESKVPEVLDSLASAIGAPFASAVAGRFVYDSAAAVAKMGAAAKRTEQERIVETALNVVPPRRL